MTLIVARANAAGLRIIADTRASFVSREATRHPVAVRPGKPLEGVLKSVLLNHSQCVAFAGDVAVAQAAIEGIVADGTHLLLDDDAVLARLLGAHVESHGATDFILGSVLGPAKLYEVKDGAVERGVRATWLGSRDAFAEYQRHYLTSPHAPAAARSDPACDELARMTNAMHQLIEGEQTFDDVGDFLISVASRPHGLVYLPYAITSFRPCATDSADLTALQMGDAATGAYSYAVLCPTSSGVPLVAVYFAHGGFGAVFAPFQAREPVLFDAKTAESFVAQVERSTQQELCGTVMLSDRAIVLRRHEPAA